MTALRQRASANPGIWNNNPVMLQMLGLSPLLALSTSLITGLAIGMALLAISLVASLVVSLAGARINATWRFFWYLLIVATLVTVLDLLLQWRLYPLARALNIYLPLLACNLAVVTQLEFHAYRKTPTHALRQAGVSGLGFLAAIAPLSALREWLIDGAVLGNLELLTADSGTGLIIQANNGPFAFAREAPAALILFGLMVALYRVVERHLASRRSPGAIEPAQRARITDRV